MRVAIEHQRQGIGRRLVEAAADFGKREGYSAIILETTPQQVGAVALYEATGFKKVGSSTIEFGGRSFDQVWCERELQT